MKNKILWTISFCLGSLLLAEDSLSVDINAYAIDNFFLFIAAVLVLFMQAGFAMLEAGLNSSKNTVNILFKNIMDLSAGALLYYIIGYGLMYPGDGNGWFAFAGMGVSAVGDSPGAGVLSPQVDWLFQVALPRQQLL